MATPIVVPREGQSMETATIVKWDVAVGDTVKFGDVLCEAESEKASFDIESAVSGKVLAILFEEGSEVPVLSTIAIVGKEGEDISTLADANSQPAEAPPEPEIKPEPKAEAPAPKAPAPSAPKAGERRRISPRAFKLAQDNNVPIEEISADPIIEADVLAYLEAQKAAGAPAAVYAPLPLTMHFRANAGALLRYIGLLNSSPLSDTKLSVGDMAAYASAQTLKALGMPSAMEFARAEGDALAASAIADSASLSLYGIAKAAASPCSFTLPTHLGICDFASLGAYAAIPNLKEGEWGSLGIGRIVLESVRTESGIEHIDMLPLSLTVDTNITDTAAAANFMRKLVSNIEHIDMLAAR